MASGRRGAVACSCRSSVCMEPARRERIATMLPADKKNEEKEAERMLPRDCREKKWILYTVEIIRDKKEKELRIRCRVVKINKRTTK